MARLQFLLTSVFVTALLVGAGCSPTQPSSTMPDVPDTSLNQPSVDSGLRDDSWETSEARENEREDERENEQEDEWEDDDDRVEASTPAVNPTQSSASTATTVNTYTMAEVITANSASKCWTVVSGKVYDLTKEINRHPGGEQAILGLCGQDGTTAFTAQHGGQRRPTTELTGLQIGTLR